MIRYLHRVSAYNNNIIFSFAKTNFRPKKTAWISFFLPPIQHHNVKKKSKKFVKSTYTTIFQFEQGKKIKNAFDLYKIWWDLSACRSSQAPNQRQHLFSMYFQYYYIKYLIYWITLCLNSRTIIVWKNVSKL